MNLAQQDSINDALAHLREEIGEEGVIEVVGLFLTDTVEVGHALRTSFDAHDADVLRRSAHTLKSTAATVGAHTLSAHCREVERLAREHRIAECAGFVDAAESELALVVAKLRAVQAEIAAYHA